ncbi:MAG: NAD-dependent epimerase/dehydratase family protein [Thermoleophilia bacterium]
MNILITGGAGFVGSHTTELFVKDGHKVRIVDDFSSGTRDNLTPVTGEIELIDLDIRNYEALESACDGIDAILHLAAISSVEKSIHEPLMTHEVNATGSLNIIEAARRKSVRRVILASSAAIYGDHDELPKTENTPVQPNSLYAWHKLTGEFYGRTYGELYGIEFLALRYFNVYGTRQDPKSPYSGVLSIFVDRSLKGEPLTIHGDGGQTRDFIHVSDVAKTNLLAVDADWPLPQIINVATGRETRIIDAAGIIQGAAASQAGLVYASPRTGDIRRSFATCDLLEKSLGYRPLIDIEDGLTDLVAQSG